MACRTCVFLLFWVSCAGSSAGEVPTLPINGQVMNAQARPIAGAEVAVAEQVFSGLAFTVRWQADRVLTDEKGRFALEVPALCHRDVFVVARKGGYAMAWDVVNAIRNNRLSRKQIDLVMQKPKVLAGRVVDEAGQPLGRAQVRALAEARTPGRLMGQLVFLPTEWFSTNTNHEGLFSFDCFGVEHCAYFHVQAAQRNCAYVFYPHVFADGYAAGRTDVQLSLPVEVPLTGRVLTRGRQPVAGATLTVERDHMKWHTRTWDYQAAHATTDAEGRFRFTGLPVGAHVIKLFTLAGDEAEWTGWPRRFQIRAGKRPSDLNLTVQKGGMVQIQAIDATTNLPLPNARFTLSLNRQGFSHAYYTAQTDVQGEASLRAPSGPYRLTGDIMEEFRIGFKDEVTIKSGQTVFVKCPMTRKPTWAGRVVDAQGQSVAGVCVRAQPWGDEVRSGPNGRFLCGTHRKPQAGLMFWARDIASNRTAMADITAEKPVTTLTLGPGLHVQGRITDQAAVPIPAARVSLTIRGPGFLSPLGAETLTDAAGCYAFSAIPPRDSTFRYCMSISVVGYGPLRHLHVTLEGRPGDTVDLGDIRLHPTDRTIAGTASRANGTPFAHNVVCVGSRDRFGQPSYRVVTDAQGRFSVSGVCDGPLRLQADMASSPTGFGQTYAWGGEREVRVVIGKERYHERQVSLVGKPLLPLRYFDMDHQTAAGRPLLLCFVDLEQRPSRRLIKGIAQRLAALKVKHVQVETVQASRVSKAQLAAWRQEYTPGRRLSFLKSSIEQNKGDWGVKALPWLVLTDKDHIVRAEGFTLNELDALIQ